ncbi:hypothetical protein HMPREF1705_04688 [Acetomicrobium hydrogeniformans ATCC BAA-1850]|uniref:Uncharacterized protein n=1 Tax=Acetomicrobium hydrogeniformans ATCC BAA-1850 TaxID=592015 RepID=A0A0T5XCK2_9BACT|nr:hypothetical protein HMPREF1705_04688 [Acetomicrobium hydrogeniformans ATCC BAA-1850]
MNIYSRIHGNGDDCFVQNLSPFFNKIKNKGPTCKDRPGTLG